MTHPHKRLEFKAHLLESHGIQAMIQDGRVYGLDMFTGPIGTWCDITDRNTLAWLGY